MVSFISLIAPSGDVTDYDRTHLALYAALLDADDSGQEWTATVRDLMGLDPTAADAETCWKSHLDRARWIVGEGLAQAVSSFGRSE